MFHPLNLNLSGLRGFRDQKVNPSSLSSRFLEHFKNFRRSNNPKMFLVSRDGENIMDPDVNVVGDDPRCVPRVVYRSQHYLKDGERLAKELPEL